jgi:hypothetical protein
MSARRVPTRHSYTFLKKAINRAKKTEPDKKGIIAYPDSAKGLLEGAASAGGLVTAFTKAVEAVRKFF